MRFRVLGVPMGSFIRGCPGAGLGRRVWGWLPGDCCFNSPQHPPLEERCAFQVSQIVDVPAFIIAQDI